MIPSDAKANAKQEIKEMGLYLKIFCKNYLQNLKCNVKRMCNLFLSFKLSLIG